MKPNAYMLMKKARETVSVSLFESGGNLMHQKDWLIVIFPKEKLRKVSRCIEQLRQETYWGKIIHDIAILFLSNNREWIRQAFIELNFLKLNEDINMIFVNDLGIIS